MSIPRRYFVLKALAGRAGAGRAGVLALACSASGVFSPLPTVEKKLASLLVREGGAIDCSARADNVSSIGWFVSGTGEPLFTSSIGVTSSGRLRPARAPRLVGRRLESCVIIVLPNGFR